jgi:hypothetical protein
MDGRPLHELCTDGFGFLETISGYIFAGRWNAGFLKTVGINIYVYIV